MTICESSGSEQCPRAVVPARRGIAGALLTLMTLVLVPAISCSPEERTASGPGNNSQPEVSASTPISGSRAGTDTTASALATADTGSYVASSAPVVEKYQAQLGDLSRRYGEDERVLAALALRTQKQLLEKGVDETTLSILGAVNKVSQSGNTPPPLAKLFAVYQTLRMYGSSREEAINKSSPFMKRSETKTTEP